MIRYVKTTENDIKGLVYWWLLLGTPSYFLFSQKILKLNYGHSCTWLVVFSFAEFRRHGVQVRLQGVWRIYKIHRKTKRIKNQCEKQTKLTLQWQLQVGLTGETEENVVIHQSKFKSKLGLNSASNNMADLYLVTSQNGGSQQCSGFHFF